METLIESRTLSVPFYLIQNESLFDGELITKIKNDFFGRFSMLISVYLTQCLLAPRDRRFLSGPLTNAQSTLIV